MRPTGPKLDKDGFPIPQGFDEAGVDDLAHDSGATMRRIRWVLRMALLAALVTFVWNHYDLGKKFSDRVGQYFGQEALNLYRRNDLPRALAAADRAVQWSPANVDLLMIRCQLKFLNKDYEAALADAEAALKHEPLDMQAHAVRRQVFHYLARHRDAAAAAGDLLERQLGDRAELLNGRAYARALGDFELPEALKDIEESLKTAPDNAAFLDTRGYVLLKLGKHEEALADLEKAIDLVEKQRREVEGFGMDREMLGQFGRTFRSQMQRIEQDLAVMLHHRGEVYEKLGKQRQAERDFRAAERYGFNPAAGVY